MSCYCEVFPHENHLSVLGKKQVGRHVTLGTISFGLKIKLIGETYWFIEEWMDIRELSVLSVQSFSESKNVPKIKPIGYFKTFMLGYLI